MELARGTGQAVSAQTCQYNIDNKTQDKNDQCVLIAFQQLGILENETVSNRVESCSFVLTTL